MHVLGSYIIQMIKRIFLLLFSVLSSSAWFHFNDVYRGNQKDIVGFKIHSTFKRRFGEGGER